MKVLPEDYRKIDMSRSERLFIRYAERAKVDLGYFLLHINPALQQGEVVDSIIMDEGVLAFRFYEMEYNAGFPMMLNVLKTVAGRSESIIIEKLRTNNSLVYENGDLIFPFSYVLVFPNIEKEKVKESVDFDSYEHLCLFKDDLILMKDNFESVCRRCLSYSSFYKSEHKNRIEENSVNSILQRIAPEYTTVRIVSNKGKNVEYSSGAADELLVITPDDIAVKAYRLDTEQINIVNRMLKGDQLILACAGSGKSVLLIAKCFKAARMNPDKRFLITCYNANLMNLYVWFIERAGLKERNVDCLTFDSLCKKLLEEAKLPVPIGGDHVYEERRLKAINAMNNGMIKRHYYGVFIDEVQIFSQEWYKFCYNLLENKNSDDHLFVICGDKTQNVEKLKRHGKAPWNAGEGYPNFRGGNKSIRIEKNYRNCIEVNEYINRFSEYARRLINMHTDQDGNDPDIFLRGKAFKHGYGVEVNIGNVYAKDESLAVIKAIRKIHDNYKIPYDEIAVIFGKKQYKPLYYYIAQKVVEDMELAGIPYNDMAGITDSNRGYYGDEGVSLITIRTSLGLDYRAVILCGLMPMGIHSKTKALKEGPISEEQEASLRSNIRQLYVACSRAKEVLYIQLPDDGRASVYSKLLKSAMNKPEELVNA